MVKWSPISLLLSVALLQAQWTQATGYPQPAGQYPQSQYPQPSQYPQSQYPDQQPQSQPSSNAPDPADLQHGVARVSIAQGDVNIRRGDNAQLSGAVVNTPLVAHDHLETSPGSRAEVQLDAATLLRLAPNTDLGFADLQYHRAQIQLGLGTVIFRVLQNSATQVEIDTPSVGIRALAPGEYRISVFDNGTSQVIVRTGQLELSGPRGTERLDAGRNIMVRGDASNPEMQDLTQQAPDQFDQWSQDRDREVVAPRSYQYVNADVQGAADLDHYGNWVPSGYGQAWQPQGVAPDWSPYSNGQWSYVDYYGWSWIDYSPWGWAPYHYGRWFNNPGYGWCWWPGSRLSPAYWSPALVGFFGFGGGIGIGFGGLGWVALAPFELFHSWWGRGGLGFGFGYHGGYGLASYRNAAFRGGAMTASLNAFAGPHQRFAAATRSQIMGASSINGRLPVTASRAGFNYSARTAMPNDRFASVQSRSFFHQSASSRSFTSSSPNSYRNGYSSGNAGSAGWQHFGSPAATAPRQGFQSSETSGWHSFGQPQARTNGFQSAPRYSAPAGSQPPPYNSYQQSAPRSYSQPRANYPSAAPRQNYSAPASHQAQPHSAPAVPHGGGGGSHGGGGGGSHGGGGGHHGR